MISPFPYVTFITVFHMHNGVMGADQSGRRFNLLIGGIQTAIPEVFPDRSGKQVGRLQHISNAAVQPQHTALPVVLSINENSAACGLKKAAGQIYQCGFSRAGFAHNGDGGSGGNVKIEVAEHLFLAVRIAEAHVLKGNIALDRLPVFLFRVKTGAVFFNHFRAILNSGFQFQQVGHPLDIGLNGNKVGDNLSQPLDRFKDIQRIVDEHRQCTDLQCLGHIEGSALYQHKANRQRAEKHNDGNIQGVEHSRPHGILPHILGNFRELPQVLVFDNQRFTGSRAGNPLVIRPGNIGIDAAYPAVDCQNPFLENHSDNGNQGNNGDNGQRQLPVDKEHGDHTSQHKGGCPENIHQTPREHGADLIGITHGTGHDGAHRRDIIIGKAQGLQMIEHRPLQIPSQIHFHPQGQTAEKHRTDGLQGQNHKIEDGKRPDSLHGLGNDKGIDGIALKQRIGNIHRCIEKHQKHNQQDFSAVRFEKRDHFRPDFERKGLLLVVIHPLAHSAALPSVSSPMPCARQILR